MSEIHVHVSLLWALQVCKASNPASVQFTFAFLPAWAKTLCFFFFFFYNSVTCFMALSIFFKRINRILIKLCAWCHFFSGIRVGRGRRRMGFTLTLVSISCRAVQHQGGNEFKKYQEEGDFWKSYHLTLWKFTQIQGKKEIDRDKGGWGEGQKQIQVGYTGRRGGWALICVLPWPWLPLDRTVTHFDIFFICG